jgi:hypothetical protein
MNWIGSFKNMHALINDEIYKFPQKYIIIRFILILLFQTWLYIINNGIWIMWLCIINKT